MLLRTQFKTQLKFDLLFLVFIFALALSLIIRFKPIYEGTFPYLFDHGRDYLDVRKIVEEGNFTFIGPTTGVVGIYHGPLHYYLLAIGYFLSAGHPASGVVTVVLAHIIGGIACYFLGSRFFSRQFGVLLSIIFLLSISSIRSSTLFWNPYWIPPLMVFFYFALIAALQISTKYWYLVLFIAGLIGQFEIAFSIFIIPFIFFSAFLSENKVFKDRNFWFSLPLFAVPFLPLIAFDIKNGFMMTRAALSVLDGSYGLLGDSIPLLLRFRYRFAELWRVSFESFSEWQLLNLVLFLICLGFLVFILIKRRKEDIYYVLFFLLLPFLIYVGFMFYPKPAWSYYWIGVQTSFYFFAAYVLSKTSEGGNSFRSIVIVLIGTFFFYTAGTLFKSTDFISREPGIYINQLRVIDTIYGDADGAKFSAFAYTPPIYDHTYRYLFYWRGKQQGFIPLEQSNGLVYLILEEDKERPWLVDAFRGAKIGGSRPVWTKKYPGNITLEKYDIN